MMRATKLAAAIAALTSFVVGLLAGRLLALLQLRAAVSERLSDHNDGLQPRGDDR
jgi:hypothetical protein